MRSLTQRLQYPKCPNWYVVHTYPVYLCISNISTIYMARSITTDIFWFKNLHYTLFVSVCTIQSFMFNIRLGILDIHHGTIMAEHLYTFVNPSNPKHLAKIDHALQNHGIVALPMGTSRAFCCNYKSKIGIEKLRKLNPNHPDDRPFSLICHDISMISEVGFVIIAEFLLCLPLAV